VSTGAGSGRSGNYGTSKLTLSWPPSSNPSTSTPDTTMPTTPDILTPTTPEGKAPKNKSPKSKSPQAKTTKRGKTAAKQPVGKPTQKIDMPYLGRTQAHRVTGTSQPQPVTWQRFTTSKSSVSPTTGWHYSRTQGIWVHSTGTLGTGTAVTLPQTQEQSATGWQLVGLALLSGISWLGLRRKRH